MGIVDANITALRQSFTPLSVTYLLITVTVMGVSIAPDWIVKNVAISGKL